MIEEFASLETDFSVIKENIRWYASINLMHGKLRIEIPPEFPVPIGEAGNPVTAEMEDRKRQMQAAPPAPAATIDAASLARIVALENTGVFMPFDHKTNISHQIQLIGAVTGRIPGDATELKRDYISSLNSLQNTSIPCQDEVIITFTNPNMLDELCREGLIQYDHAHLFQVHEQHIIASAIADAFVLIKAVSIDLHDAIRSMIGAIACIRREGSSGTVSSMVGLLWLNPTPGWSILDYAENIVHEFIHNTIFLADMVEKIFTTPHWYTPEDALVVSAIKKYPRGINISYHSVLVALGLTIFMSKANQPKRAETLASGLEETLDGLSQKSSRFLSDYGTKILSQINIREHAVA